MFRKTLLALIAIGSFGAAPTIYAQERDGDGHSVPGVSVTVRTGAWERAYAGPRPATYAGEQTLADRLSLVH